MSLQIHQFVCLEDNYAFLVLDEESGQVACIDTPDPQAILNELQLLDWKLTKIFNTHWHDDHAGGNLQIQSATGCEIYGPAEIAGVAPIDHIVEEGDVVHLGQSAFEILDVGGHTHRHIAYYAPEQGVVFVGDVLFPLGCGRVFEGTASQMWNSLQKLLRLDDATRVYSAHEYAKGNALFALSVDSSPEVQAYADEIFLARAEGRPTVPTTIKRERATNPFVRAPFLMPDLGDVEAFAAVRSKKDNFRA